WGRRRAGLTAPFTLTVSLQFQDTADTLCEGTRTGRAAGAPAWPPSRVAVMRGHRRLYRFAGRKQATGVRCTDAYAHGRGALDQGLGPPSDERGIGSPRPWTPRPPRPGVHGGGGPFPAGLTGTLAGAGRGWGLFGMDVKRYHKL